MSRFLLLGKDGQVGWELQRALAPLGEVIALGREECNLADPGMVQSVVRETSPSVIVNAAAYTAVDKAQSEPDLARAVNSIAPGILAREAALLDTLLVHYSTDYVFDGSKPTPYIEDDETGPLNVYGSTKLAGEDAIRASGCRHLVFRTSWVYAARGGNFARTMLRLATERNELKVVCDQIGAPTSAELIADVTALCLYRLNQDPRFAEQASGIYHLVAGGETSWHGYASWVIAEAQKHGMSLRAGPDQVHAIPSSEYPTPAARPANSRLDSSKLCRTFGIIMPPWQLHAARLIAEIV